MSEFKIQMPKLGESVQEATITKWFIKEGDKIEEDDSLFEVATDKVDSEIPSPVDGIVRKILFKADDVVPVGEIVAILEVDGDDEPQESEKTNGDNKETTKEKVEEKTDVVQEKPEAPVASKNEIVVEEKSLTEAEATRFYSPLVKSIAKSENISIEELESIEGSGANGRVRKEDILTYLQQRESGAVSAPSRRTGPVQPKVSVSIGSTDQIIEMDRVRKLIAEHMVMSKQVSPHVTSVVEADVTNLVLWRSKIKDEFASKHGQKITFMPVFIEAVAKALSEYPILNSSVDGTKIIVHKDINVGIAVAKPDGNLVVPVIKNAEQKNLVGITKAMNQMAESARTNKLSPEDYQGGTFTITNFGSFRNIIGTPIINQPQVAILATGSIEKKPAVMETPTGDAIVVRHKMFLSLSYDHRIVDGAMGGAFLRRIADILEDFNINRTA